MPIRTFSMNSEEFYRAMTPPPEPWRWGPGLPKDPPRREQEVIVERGVASRKRRSVR